jgi:predicted nucleotidyltransferase
MSHAETRTSITEDLLAEIKNRIVEHFHPKQIILFGSHAYGNPNRDSDIDLLVIMDTNLRHVARSAAILRACRPKYIAMDIVVRTPEEIENLLKRFDPFLKEILEHGRILYKSAG